MNQQLRDPEGGEPRRQRLAVQVAEVALVLWIAGIMAYFYQVRGFLDLIRALLTGAA
jgi:hypothetical protein